MAWLLLILIAFVLLLVLIKLIQVVFGLIAIAVIVVAFFILRERLRAWWTRERGSR